MILMKPKLLIALLFVAFAATAQDRMTPEILWSLHRVNGEGVSRDGKFVYYSSKTVDWKSEKSSVLHYKIGVEDGVKKEFTTSAGKTITQRCFFLISSATTKSAGACQAIYLGIESKLEVRGIKIQRKVKEASSILFCSKSLIQIKAPKIVVRAKYL